MSINQVHKCNSILKEAFSWLMAHHDSCLSAASSFSSFSLRLPPSLLLSLLSYCFLHQQKRCYVKRGLGFLYRMQKSRKVYTQGVYCIAATVYFALHCNLDLEKEVGQPMIFISLTDESLKYSQLTTPTLCYP